MTPIQEARGMKNVSELFGQGGWSKGVFFVGIKAHRPVFRTENASSQTEVEKVYNVVCR